MLRRCIFLRNRGDTVRKRRKFVLFKELFCWWFLSAAIDAIISSLPHQVEDKQTQITFICDVLWKGLHFFGGYL